MITFTTPDETYARSAALHSDVRLLHDGAWEDSGPRPGHALALAARAQSLIANGNNWDGTEADDAEISKFVELASGAVIDLLAENLATQSMALVLLQEQVVGINMDAAAYMSQKALAILTDAATPIIRARVGYAQAAILKYQLDYDVAETTLRSVLALLPADEEVSAGAATLPELRLRIDALNHIGRLQMFRGDFQQAMETEVRCLGLATQTTGTGEGYPSAEAFALRCLAIIYHRLGDFAEAAQALHRSQEISNILGDYFSKSATLNNLGSLSQDMDELIDAAAYYNQALDLCREHGFIAQEAIIVANIGCLLHKQGERESAVEHYVTGLATQQKIRHLRAEAGTRVNLGALLREMGRYGDAQAHLEKALKIHRALADRNGIATCLINLGCLQSSISAGLTRDEADSEPSFRVYLDEALEVIALLGTQDLLISAHEAYARAYKSAGNFELALHHFELFHDLNEEMVAAHALDRTRTLLFKRELEQSRKDTNIQHRHALELRSALDEARVQRALAEHHANEDILTGLPNRRYGDQLLAAALKNGLKNGQPLSILLADADQFKAINDRYSHSTGDRVLRALADICRENCRSGEIAIRYGGEELLFLLPGADREQAIVWAERLRARVEQHDWSALQADLALTLSLGVCTWSAPDAPMNPDAMLAVADGHLYEAKKAGRNCVRS